MALLLTWNPQRWTFDDGEYETYVEDTAQGRPVRFRWSIGPHRHGIHPGDRAYLLRQGPEKRGLVGAGVVVGEPFPDRNWNPDGEREAWYVEVDWDEIRRVDDRIPTEELLTAVPRIHWNSLFSSGSPVGPDEALLEQVWRGQLPPGPGAGPAGGLPAETAEEALELLRRLVGVPLRTGSGRALTITGVSPTTVTVATDRSSGRAVPVLDVQDALDSVRAGDSWEILPETSGVRGALVDAVLRTLPGGRVYGSPPLFTLAATARDGGSELDTVVTFEGSLSSFRTAEQRGEQAVLRRMLLGGAAEAECALCGRTFPVRFLRAAHIKPRSLCSDLEKRDVANIAMTACVFGCDPLYESGLVAVDDAGAVVVPTSGFEGPLAEILGALEGRRTTAFSPANAAYFEWHRVNKFIG